MSKWFYQDHTQYHTKSLLYYYLLILIMFRGSVHKLPITTGRYHGEHTNFTVTEDLDTESLKGSVGYGLVCFASFV